MFYLSTNEFFDFSSGEDQKKEIASEKKKGSYESGRTYISYSQYATWKKCPRSWKLNKIDKLGKFESSIASIFGTAMHEAIQDCLTLQYESGSIAADNFDYLTVFKSVFLKEYNKALEQGVVITIEQVKDHIADGMELLKYILSSKNRNKYFPKFDHKLVGIEVELDEEISNNVKFKGFIDVVLQEVSTGKIKVFDIKTSTRGWNKYQKADLMKLDQVLLYKKFFSDRFSVPMKDIEVQFLILKRKLYEDATFYQIPIQVVKPSDGKKSVQESYERLGEFVETCFDENGVVRKNIHYPKNPGKAKKNCKYCPFHQKVGDDGNVICDGKSEKE
jgi:hypothetical protein